MVIDQRELLGTRPVRQNPRRWSSIKAFPRCSRGGDRGVREGVRSVLRVV